MKIEYIIQHLVHTKKELDTILKKFKDQHPKVDNNLLDGVGTVVREPSLEDWKELFNDILSNKDCNTKGNWDWMETDGTQHLLKVE